MDEATGRGTAERERGSNWKLYAFDLASVALTAALIGAVLFAISGVWPPMVAVESGSMEPVLERGDLVFVMEETRFPGAAQQGETGVVTAAAGSQVGYRSLQGPGDVVVYQPDGNAEQTPIIHRAMFWVEAGENWYDRANPRFLGGAESCDEIRTCPAPHAGFVTKGDANGGYDQVMSFRSCDGACDPVKPEWVVGTAEGSIPYVGTIRLQSGGVTATGGSATATDGAGTGAGATNGTGAASTNGTGASATNATAVASG